MPRDMPYIRLSMLPLMVGIAIVVYIHIGVGSALLVSNNRVMRRPLERETSNRYRFSRFFILNKEYVAESGELIGKGDENFINYKFYGYETHKTLADDGSMATMQHHGKCSRF